MSRLTVWHWLATLVLLTLIGLCVHRADIMLPLHAG